MNVKFYWVGASTIIININNDIKIACNPVLAAKNEILKFKSFDSRRIIGPSYDIDVFNNIDIWILTHGHIDHIDEKSNIICCKNVALILDDINYTNAKTLKWNQKLQLTIKDYKIVITAIPAFHGNSFIMRNVIGKANGYLLQIENNNKSKTFYITGDTVYTDKIIKSLHKIHIDYLLANLGQGMSNKKGGPITMSCDMLNHLCQKLIVKKVIPLHINDFSHYETTENEVLKNGYEILKRGIWTSI